MAGCNPKDRKGWQVVAVVKATEAAIAEAADALRAGGLVAFPTETVYGLGADATNGDAVAAIFAAKGRPRFNPLIAHVADEAIVDRYAEYGGPAARLGAAFWPGPLTLVLPRRPSGQIADLVTAGLDTVAMRVPSHHVARALLRRAGRPIAAPSANRSGHVSATTAAHVAADLGAAAAMILDGGPTQFGLESTVVAVDARGVRILRSGAITAVQIEAVIGETIVRAPDGGDHPTSPGQLLSHYAPRAAVQMNATTVAHGEALLAFGAMPLPTTGAALNLSRQGDLFEAAANLFAHLRALDATGVTAIVVMPIPTWGLGEAINDRLQRAGRRLSATDGNGMPRKI